MRFKPTPLTEASLIFSLAWVLIFVSFTAFSLSIEAGQLAATGSVFYLILGYILWVVAGIAVRKKSVYVRFFTTVSINAVVTVVVIELLNALMGQSTLASATKATIIQNFTAFGVGFFVMSTAAAAVTQFYLVRPKKAKI